MRKNFFNILIIPLLVGCKSTEVVHNTIEENTPIIEIDHEYNEVDYMHIEWEEIFNGGSDPYYVYFYSITCSHCENLKNEIIEIALNRNDIFFVKASNKIVLKNDVIYTIGAGNIRDFAILGYPSLIKIENNICVKNVAGRTQILNALK